MPSRIVDIASGAGSIYGCLDRPQQHLLHAVDISHEALMMLRQRLPGTETVACSAANVPFRDRTFDAVVSQFGVEYAGHDAFLEAGRLVAPRGRLVILCHYRDGYIDNRNQAQLAGATLVRDSAFIDLALELTSAAFAGDAARNEAAVSAFIPAERQVSETVRNQPDGVHAHLYLGFRKLYEQRQDYRPQDITGWLDQMRGEVDKSIYRLSNIISVALSEDDMKNISARLAQRSLESIGFEPFASAADAPPVAWHLSATGREA